MRIRVPAKTMKDIKIVKLSLEALYPQLVQEQWHSSNVLKPENVSSGSHQRAQWKCNVSNTHIWSAEIKSVVSAYKNGKSGCPFCNGKKVDGKSCLVIKNPELAKQWHSSNKLKPTQVTISSNKKVKWQCPKDISHVWIAPINQRQGSWHGKHQGCPFCANKRINHTNCLATTHPELAKQWHFSNELKSNQVVAFSHIKVFWQCPIDENHVWLSSIAHMVRSHIDGNTGCPFCAGYKVNETNCLAVTHPMLAKEWHSTNKTKPTEVTAGASKRVKWQCQKNIEHVWIALISSRRTRGCPYCFEETRGKKQRERHSRLFVQLAQDVHCNKNYDYSQAHYITCREPVKIGCPIHGWFFQKPMHHLIGHGCHYCSNRILEGTRQIPLNQLEEMFNQETERNPNVVELGLAALGLKKS